MHICYICIIDLDLIFTIFLCNFYFFSMTIALLHNYYQQRGGEDAVFESEARWLEKRGHNVVTYSVHNDDVAAYSASRLARATFWNNEAFDKVAALFRRTKPDVAHFHNIFPLLSPSVYAAANKQGIPVVQTLHNYRLLCPNALFFRNGGVCEDCLGKALALPGVVHKCYRSSFSASAAVAGMTAWHSLAGTWKKKVQKYIALTEFAKQKFIMGGLPSEKIVVKPNFVETDAGFSSADETRNYVLYVGRLSEEKGIMTALKAWSKLGSSRHNHEFIVIGEGPLQSAAKRYASEQRLNSVKFLGQQPLSSVLEWMKFARALLFPSLLYETFGKSMIEAFSVGTPVIASGLGALAEVVDDGVTGFHCTVARPESLAERLQKLFTLPENQYSQMRKNARNAYERRYTPEINMSLLESVYEECLSNAGR